MKKKEKLTSAKFDEWFNAHMLTLFSEPIILAMETIFDRYVEPNDFPELYDYLVALYVYYLMPIKDLPLQLEQYLDLRAIELADLASYFVTSNAHTLNKDFQRKRFKKSYQGNVISRIDTFRRIWEKKIKEEPKWLEHTKTRTARVRYILSHFEKNSRVTEKTGLKYLDEIEKEREKI